jgi:hypothetical protein
MTAMPELYTNGAQILHTNRRRVQPIGGLSQAQLEWCRQKWPWFEHNRVQRLADPQRQTITHKETI